MTKIIDQVTSRKDVKSDEGRQTRNSNGKFMCVHKEFHKEKIFFPREI